MKRWFVVPDMQRTKIRTIHFFLLFFVPLSVYLLSILILICVFALFVLSCLAAAAMERMVCLGRASIHCVYVYNLTIMRFGFLLFLLAAFFILTQSHRLLWNASYIQFNLFASCHRRQLEFLPFSLAFGSDKNVDKNSYQWVCLPIIRDIYSVICVRVLHSFTKVNSSELLSMLIQTFPKLLAVFFFVGGGKTSTNNSLLFI